MARRAIILTMVGLALAMGVQAGERGTPAEARAMLEKAVAHYKAVGRKQALADFNARKAPFSDNPESKVSFVQKVGEDACGVGAYRERGVNIGPNDVSHTMCAGEQTCPRLTQNLLRTSHPRRDDSHQGVFL